MTLRASATHAAVWGLAQKWGHHGIRLLVFVIMARLLEPEAFGLVALAGVFVFLGEMLVDQGFADALVQRRCLGPAHLDAAFWASLGTGAALTAAMLLGAGPLAAGFGQPGLEAVLLGLSPVILIASLSRTQEALLRRRLAFRPIARIAVSAVMAGGIAGLVMAAAGFGVWSLVGQLVIQKLVELPCLWRVTGWRPRLRFSPPHFRALFRFGINVVGINLLNLVNRQADHLLIGYFLGASALGYYTVGYRLIRILLDLLPHALMPVAFSTFSRLQGDPQRMRNGMYEATRVLALAAFPAFCGMALLAPELLSVLFGSRWLPSAEVMRALAPVGILQSIVLLYPTVLKASGRPELALLITAVNAFVNVIAFSVAVHWGIVAVAAAYTARGYLVWPLAWWTVRRVLTLDPVSYARALAPAVAGTALMAAGLLAGIRYSPPGDPATGVILAWGVPAGMLAYGAVVYALDPGLRRWLRQLPIRRGMGLTEHGHG